MKGRQLVLFTVGPVQSFIASARKIEDFWSGSYILSHLIREALKELYSQEESFELIFPVISKEEIDNPNHDTLHIASLPNRFTAIMAGKEDEIIARLKQTELRVKEAFYDICKKSIENLFVRLSEDKRTRLLEMSYEQIDAFLEIYWVIEPYETAQDFETVRERLESRLGALKNDKEYPQVPQYGLTCSVCHERDALCVDTLKETDRYGDLKRKLVATWNERISSFKEGSYRIKDNEFLCGVCIGKRFARDYFKEFYQYQKGFLGFESVVKIAGEEENYYGIFLMDGDNMGAWFSGKQAEEYSMVSKKLSSFAMNTVPNIVEKKYSGRIVYAGGDDLLAFMPVHEALKIADGLRFAFSNNKEGLGEEATASASLIIAHERAPLQTLLNDARLLETKAKSYRNSLTGETKNALAIRLHTRSGDVSEAILPWKIGGSRTVEILTNIIHLLKNELSSTFIYHFTATFLPLIDSSKEEYRKVESSEIMELELRRLIQRSAKVQISHEKLENVINQLILLHENVPTTMDFLYLLKMLTFFQRKEAEV